MSLANIVPTPSANREPSEVFQKSNIPMIQPIKHLIQVIDQEIKLINPALRYPVRVVRNNIEDQIWKAIWVLPKWPDVPYGHMCSLAQQISRVCTTAITDIEKILWPKADLVTYCRWLDFSEDRVLAPMISAHRSQTALAVLSNTRFRTQRSYGERIPHADEILAKQKAAML